MKATLEQVPICTDCSFLVREFNVPYFEAPLHFHPVYELTLITGGEGKRFVGDHIDNFESGDLVLIGSNVPHLYRCDDKYYKNDPLRRAKAIIIQFSDNCLGDNFFNIPEMSRINKLLVQSKRGIQILGTTRKRIVTIMNKIKNTTGVDRLIMLLQILNVLSVSEELKLLGRANIIAYSTRDNERMNRIYEYLLNNFNKSIRLSHVAEVANMSEASFCRFFKKKTRKTFTSFLNEIRIGYASKLLIEDELNVGQICYKSGFENLSNFNRQFKELTSLNPLTYRAYYKEKLPQTTEYLTL